MNTQKENLYRHVDFLTSIRPWRNYRNPESLKQVCDYLRAEFSAYGYTSEDQKWIAETREYTNVIASYNTHKSKRLIVGAHYDVCGNQPGADDNASAVAGLLESARLVALRKPDIDYRIDFVAYCLEEPPFFGSHQMGSYVHAKSLFDSGTEVIGMICYEMIGYFSDEPNSQPFPSPELALLYPHTANFIMVVGIEAYREFNNRIHALMKPKAEIDVQVISFPGMENLAAMSDQRNYWKFGYPALMINDTAFVRNPHYHELTDTIDTLDFDKMKAVVNAAFQAITGL
ncbi:MAG: M28 family peptidase [Bacteroidetes bacterium]|nr:M28 family peptidase [Bacteroidota bacterium]